MKIKRFENINEDMIFDLPWTEKKFEEISELKKEIKATEESLFELLSDYINLYPDIVENESEFYIKEFYYKKYNPFCRLEIVYYDDDNDERGTALDPNQFEDFLKFLKDPDLYKNSKKYNL